MVQVTDCYSISKNALILIKMLDLKMYFQLCAILAFLFHMTTNRNVVILILEQIIAQWARACCKQQTQQIVVVRVMTVPPQYVRNTKMVQVGNNFK